MTRISTLAPAGRVALARPQPPPARGLAVAVLGAGADLTVRLRGEAGLAETGKLEAALMPIGARRPASVTFDFSELRFISSVGLGALVSYRRAAVRAGVRVCLAADLQLAVLLTLQATGVLGLFDVVNYQGPNAAPSDGARIVETPQ
jgi:anti-anti-sigma factor